MVSDRFDALCEEEIYQIMCSCNSAEYAQILQGDPRHTDHRMVGTRQWTLFHSPVAKETP